MLTENEILANQTQTLEEALDRLEDHTKPIDDLVDLIDTGSVDNSVVAVECLKSLVDLYHTVSIEGVSKADIDALWSIQQRLVPFAALGVKPALEGYSGMFTPNRSMINQNISQEAVLAEIGKTLKEWFYAFIDFIIKMANWCRKVLNSETAINAKLTLINMNIQDLHSQLNNVIKISAKYGRDVLPEVNKVSELVLKDPKLARNELTLIAFNVKGKADELITMDKYTDVLFSYLMKDLHSLKKHVENNDPNVHASLTGYDLEGHLQLYEALTVTNADEDLILDEVGVEFWRKPKTLIERKVFAPKRNIEQVEKVAKAIREIKRNSNFSDLKNVDALVANVEDIMRCIKVLEKIIIVKQTLLTDYYKASATTINLYVRAYDTIVEDLNTNAAEEIKDQALEAISKAWNKTLDKLGI